MIKINNYLYEGHTVIKILHMYHDDLLEDALMNKNEIDIAHCKFLSHMIDILEHNDFLTSQSQRIRELCTYMEKKYPFLSFTFKGRIKSLLRAEEKYNRYIVDYIFDEYKKTGNIPSIKDLKGKLELFRDFIAYRLVVSLPKSFVKDNENKEELELNYLYEVANMLPKFLEDRNFTPLKAYFTNPKYSPRLNPEIQEYYKDYIEKPSGIGYKSLHISFYDNVARCHIELQLRTKEMDDYAEIGKANHENYEKHQEMDKARREAIPVGLSKIYDDAFEKAKELRELDLSKLDVNMFGAINNHLINDGCGLYRGRSILPFEHLLTDIDK